MPSCSSSSSTPSPPTSTPLTVSVSTSTPLTPSPSHTPSLPPPSLADHQDHLLLSHHAAASPGLRYSAVHPVRLDGWLSKEGKSLRARRTRYVRLHGHILSSHRTMPAPPSWQVSIAHAQIHRGTHPREIRLSLSHRVLSFIAPSRIAFDAWIVAFRRASLVSSRVDDYYSIGRLIGEGMNGQVRLAHDHLTDQHVAIKMVPRLGRENETQFLAREIQIILSVSHPNIVRTIDVFVRSRRIHFVMEYLAGGELFDFIAENTHFTEAHAATVMNDLLRALFYLHARGIAHRDVKLENLLCANQTWPLHVKLADFGFANYVNACAEPMLSSFVGTPYYIAPEMLRGDPHGRPVDVWASGVVLYILLSGKFPFGGSNEAEYYQRVLSKEAYFPDEEWSTISDEAKELVRGMLCKDPRKRFTTEQCLMHSWLSKAETHVPASVNCTERQQQQQQPAWHSCQSESQLFVQSVQPVEQEERQLQQQQQASHLEALDLEHTERSLQSPSLFRENVQKKGRWRRLGMVNQSLSSASPIENASCTTNQQNTTPEKKPSDNVPNSQHVVPTTTSATDSLNSRMQDVEVRDTPPVNRRPSLIRRLLSSGKLSLDRYEGRFPSFRGSFDDPSDEATAMPRKTLSLFAKDGPLRRSFHRVGEGRSGAVDDGINFVNSQSQRLPPKIARERLRQQRQVEASRKAARGTGLFSHRKVPAADYTGHGNAYHSSPRLQSYLPHPFQTVPVPAGQRGPTSSHSVIPGVKRYASPRRRGGNHDVWQFGQVPITRRDDSPLSSADDGVVRRTVSANVTMGERHLCNSGLVKIDYLSGKKRPTDDPLPRTAQVRV